MIGGTRCRVLACLSDTEWRPSTYIADTAGTTVSLAIYHLKRLEADGHAICRGAWGIREWCWVPGGYADLCLNSEANPVPM